MKNKFYVTSSLNPDRIILDIVKAKRSDLALKMTGASFAYKFDTRKEAEDFRDSKIKNKNNTEFVHGKYMEYIPQKYAVD